MAARNIDLDAIAQRSTLAGIAAARRFRLPFARHIRRGPAGDLAGRDGGGALEFQDQRDYHPGDDPRHLNWAAYARSGQLTMKVFQQEIRPLLDLVIDISATMTLTAEKATRTMECIRFALASAEEAGAVVRATLADGHHIREVDRTEIAHPSWMPFKPAKPAQPERPDLSRIQWRSNSLRLFVSDLLFPGTPDACTRPLSRGASQALIFCPFDRSESDPEWTGACEFEDIESAKRVVKRADSSFIRQYTEAYTNHFRMWNEVAAGAHTTLARIDTFVPFQETLNQLTKRDILVTSN